MRFPAYPKYKPSGEAWVPELPESWDLVRLRWLSERYAGGTPDKSNSAFWDDGDIPWLNSGAVNDGYITEPSEYITREGFLGSSAKWIPKGALVMALAGQGKTKGMVAQLGFAATCNQSMAAIIPIHRIQARYLYWWLAANYFNIRNMAGGEARDGLNLELLGGIPCPVPDKDAQCAIADFLDRETAKIDTLVAKKRMLIERLKEKRTALISRTVTRGLPPDAARAAGLDPHPKLKPSGIDWLGDVPEHWEVKRLKFILATALKYGANESAELDDPTLPRYVRITDIDESDGLREETFRSLPADVAAEYLLREGDLLFARSGATAGKTFLYRQSWGECAYAGYLIRARIDKRNGVPEFVRHFTASSFYWQWLSSVFIQSTIQNVSAERYASLWIPLPPTTEQAVIAKYLDRELASLDGMVAKVETAIERLQEYRTALITAAVTGKIDVRGAAP